MSVCLGPESIARITIFERKKAHRNVFMLARWYMVHGAWCMVHGAPSCIQCVHVHVLHSIRMIGTHWICCLVLRDYEPSPALTKLTVDHDQQYSHGHFNPQILIQDSSQDQCFREWLNSHSQHSDLRCFIFIFLSFRGTYLFER